MVAAEEVAGQAVVDAVGGLGAVQREVGDPVAHLEQHVVTSHGTGCYEHRPIPGPVPVPLQEEIPPASAGGISKGPCISETLENSSVRAEGAFPTRSVRFVLPGPLPVRSGGAPADQHAYAPAPQAAPRALLRLGKEIPADLDTPYWD